MKNGLDRVSLHPEVQKDISKTTHQYTFPFTQKTARSTVDLLHRSVRGLRPFAMSTETTTLQSTIFNVQRRLGRLFRLAYECDTKEVEDWDIPTVKEINEDICWLLTDEIPPRTITIEKTEKHIRLSYEYGFHATEETLHIEKTETDSLKAAALKNCGQGIELEHAPYKPTYGEGWRYNPSKIRFSIEYNKTGLRVGIENTPPNPPLWYYPYKKLSAFSHPYAYATFNMDAQSSVVKSIYNNTQENNSDKL